MHSQDFLKFSLSATPQRFALPLENRNCKTPPESRLGLAKSNFHEISRDFTTEAPLTYLENSCSVWWHKPVGN